MWGGGGQEPPVPKNRVRIANTEPRFRSPSGSETCARIQNSAPVSTASMGSVSGIESAHFSTKSGGRLPAGGDRVASHTTVLRTVSTMIIETVYVEGRIV